MAMEIYFPLCGLGASAVNRSTESYLMFSKEHAGERSSCNLEGEKWKIVFIMKKNANI
jgi:hypothetical protein